MEAKALHFITARHVSVENLQHGTLAWGYRNKAESQLVPSMLGSHYLFPCFIWL